LAQGEDPPAEKTPEAEAGVPEALAHPPAPNLNPPAAPPVAGPQANKHEDGRLSAWVYYPLYYGVDWAIVLGTLPLFATGGYEQFRPNGNAVIGPTFDLDDPDVDKLMHHNLDARIGGLWRPEQVGTTPMVAGGVVSFLALSAADALRHTSFHRGHGLFLGGASALVWSYHLSGLAKLGFGRLRPDFRDRYVRAACAGVVEKPDALSCTGVPTTEPHGDPIVIDDVYYGMTSFPSGHSTAAFSIATFGALHIGSEWLWGPRATGLSQPLAAVAMSAMMGTAGFIATTRLSDGRHHAEDVVVGSSLGAGTALLAYLIHFDLDGNARVRGLDLAPLSVAGQGGGLAVGGTF
jgi:membrane-associated phospholipid phosphatase